MKRQTKSFTGTRPIFSGSPSIVTGGFNLDREGQKFNVGDVVPAGTLAIYDEENRIVKVLKTAKVVEVDSKNVKLHVDEFYQPTFAVGDKVLKADGITGKFSAAPSIASISKNEGKYEIVLSAEISGLKKGDILVQVISNDSQDAALVGKANSVTICNVVVGEYETSIDVTADTMQYALYERRVPPIPAAQKDETGMFLAANPHVKLSKSL